MPRLVHKATGVVVSTNDETAKQLPDYEPTKDEKQTAPRSTKK